jgi:peroxiredoxin
MRVRSRPGLIWVGLCLVGLMGTAQAQFQKSPWPQKTSMPTVEWVDVSGKTWARDQLKGKVVLINFWATWCAPCLEELPSLQTWLEFSRGTDVLVLTVNVKDPLSRIQTFMSRNGFTFPVVSDRQGAIAKQWGVKVFPTSVLLSPQGQPAWVIEGAVDWAATEAGDWIRSLQ